MYLRDADLWDVVSTAPPEVAGRDAAWLRKNNRALLNILRAFDVSQQQSIEDGATAYSVWHKIEQIYQSKDAATIQRIYIDFTNVKKVRAESIMHYIARVKSLASQLTRAGEVVSDAMLSRIQVGLGPEYEPVKAALALLTPSPKPNLHLHCWELNHGLEFLTLLTAELNLAAIVPVPEVVTLVVTVLRLGAVQTHTESALLVASCTVPHVGVLTADTCWDAYPELRDQAQDRSRLLRRERRWDVRSPYPAPPWMPPSYPQQAQLPPQYQPQYTQSAAFAEAMTSYPNIISCAQCTNGPRRPLFFCRYSSDCTAYYRFAPHCRDVVNG